MGQRPYFSIILPVYNSGVFLEKAVESLLTQSFEDFELFLIDDGSTDGSSLKCDYYAISDSRVRVIHQKNSGMGAARNKAIKLSTGRYIGFCDHDDEFLPGCFERCHEVLEKSKADAIKFGCKEIYIKNGKYIKERAMAPRREKSFSKNSINQAFLFKFDDDYMAYIWDGFYKRELFFDTLFDLSMRTGYEDEDLQMRMFPQLQSIVFIPDIFYIHNIRSDFSNSKKHNDNQFNAMLIAAKAGNNAIDALGVKEYCPEISSVLTGRHLLSALRCIVYLDSNRDAIAKMQQVREMPQISDNLIIKYIPAVFRRKKVWGIVYMLFAFKAYFIMRIIIILIRVLVYLKERGANG